jgi:hypothetical protein
VAEQLGLPSVRKGPPCNDRLELIRELGGELARKPAVVGDPPTDLSVVELELSVSAYAALRDSLASKRLQASGRLDHVTYGPTGAAKTLFALRPNVFPPWDDPMRAKLRLSGDAASFREYLTSVAEQLRQLSDEARVPVNDFPQLIGWPDSSPPKLFDEYNWVVITRRCPPPTPDEALRWAEWATKPAPGVA